MSYSFCSSDFRAEPYWWDETPPAAGASELPDITDVLVIGSGYTGLHCALQTVEAGRETTVIEAEQVGFGCSTRNGGQISGEIKPDFATLRGRYDENTALAMILEARSALAWLGDFVAEQNIECAYHRGGRFLAAHSPRQFRALTRMATSQPHGLERTLRLVAASEQAAEIDSPYYHGGLVIGEHCALDPARYHAGLLQQVEKNGARVVDQCRAISIRPGGRGYRVETSRGVIECRELAIATNGYTDAATPWQQRRVIPIGSYMLATDAMPAARAQALLPANRVYSDTRRIVVYFRLAPDGRRLLFGGRVSVFESDPVKSLPALRAEMLRIFPQLADVAISHTWMGFVAYTFDQLPHLGQQDGIHYAMGYCGSGICLASHFGHLLGRRIAGTETGSSAFYGAHFQTRPLYRGKPWFLASAVRYYQLLDRLG